jgi:uncharacterized protein (DUF1778 family)
MAETPKKKGGRPKLPPGEKKQIFPLRLSPNTQTLVESAAAREGEELQAWIRKVLTEKAKSVLCITD